MVGEGDPAGPDQVLLFQFSTYLWILFRHAKQNAGCCSGHVAGLEDYHSSGLLRCSRQVGFWIWGALSCVGSIAVKRILEFHEIVSRAWGGLRNLHIIPDPRGTIIRKMLQSFAAFQRRETQRIAGGRETYKIWSIRILLYRYITAIHCLHWLDGCNCVSWIFRPSTMAWFKLHGARELKLKSSTQVCEVALQSHSSWGSREDFRSNQQCSGVAMATFSI